jgi:hypothetical protein
MLHRTKRPDEIKLKRTIPKQLEADQRRQALIRHVLIYFPHWKNSIHSLSTKFLLMHVHSIDRYYFKDLLDDKNKN